MDAEYFHFLRPLCLLLLLPAAGLLYLVWQRQLGTSSWAQIIDPQLLSHLLDRKPQKSESWPVVVLGIAMLVAILALAGPAWKRLPQPVTQAQDALLIGLDLSLSMRSSDLTPSRIERASLKLRDILADRNEGLTALIAYAGDAHTVAPFTDDARTIEAMLPALQPEIMPKLGSRPDLALALGQQLMKDANLNAARVLLVTDEIKPAQIEAMQTALGSNTSLSILAVGTGDGGPIPLPEGGFMKDRRGDMIVTRLNDEDFKEAAKQLGARYAVLQNSRNDIDYLLPANLGGPENFRETEREFDVWRDEGALLALLLLPLCLLAFRRGLILPVLCIALLPPPAKALEPLQLWKNLWQTQDQQGQAALDAGDAESASSLFKDPNWKASASYKAGDFDGAAELFKDEDYNRGNALARAGKLEDAIESYDQALQKNPDNEDAAFNKKLIEEIKEQQDKEKEQEQQQDKDKDEQDKDKEKDQREQDGEQQDGEQNQDQQESQDQQDSDQQNQDQQDGDKQDSEQTEQEKKEQEEKEQQEQQSKSEQEAEQEEKEAQAAQAQQQPSDERQQELEQWLRKVPDDPGGLLRNKFRYQYEQNRRKREHYDKDGQIY